jgi:NAD(P)H-nitrite reductase large subunit
MSEIYGATVAGVGLQLATTVERLEHAGGRSTVIAGEHRIRADVVVMGAGVAPRSELAVQAAIALDGGQTAAVRGTSWT